jgi:hypothetical protein
MKLPSPTPLALVTAVLLVGCAGAAPRASPAGPDSPSDCRALGSEIERLATAQDEAKQAQADAWKLIVPFAVAARYANARSTAAEAERTRQDLESQAARLGCDRG